jgi:hypothetical protein
MKFKIKDIEGFKNEVYGADSFLKHWPHIATDGVEINQVNEFFYIMENGKIAHDSAFFNQEEMKYLEEVAVRNTPKFKK